MPSVEISIARGKKLKPTETGCQMCYFEDFGFRVLLLSSLLSFLIQNFLQQDKNR